jgi:hypothetical protein
MPGNLPAALVRRRIAGAVDMETRERSAPTFVFEPLLARRQWDHKDGSW